MKRFSKLIICLLSLSIFVPQASAATNITFKDMSIWARGEVSYLIEQGIISGYPDGTFRPNDPITRQQVAGMIVQALKLDTKNRPNPGFKDVSKSAYYYNAIAAVADEGIIRGSRGNYRPSEYVTRAQMAAILRRAFNFEQDWKQHFLDVEKTYWAYSDINSLYQNGITWGKQGSVFVPNELTTRAQFSTLLARALNGKFSLYPYERNINGENPAPTQSMDNWIYDYNPNELIAKNNSTGEVVSIITKEKILELVKYEDSYIDLTLDIDDEANIIRQGNILFFPIVIKSESTQIRTYFAVYIETESVEDKAVARKWRHLYFFPITDFSESRFNSHRIISSRFIKPVENIIDNKDISVEILNLLNYYDPPKKLKTITIKNDRVENGDEDPKLRDFRSIVADGSRYFYYNSKGLYSCYHDGTQEKQLLKGDVRSFYIEDTNIYVEMTTGEKYKLNYTGTKVDKF